MAQHKLDLNLPKSTVTNSDAEVVVFADDKRLGKVALSRGGIDWLPAGKSTSASSLSWEQFADVMVEKGRAKKIKRKPK